MHMETILSQLRSMSLSAMAGSLERRIANNEQHELSCEEFLALLVEDEYSARRERRHNRMLCQAGFKPEMACLENIRYKPSRGFQKRDLAPFTSDTWIKQAHNILITGPTGSGKTYLSEAIGFQAIKMGYSAKKIRYKMLFEEINEARATGMFLKYLKKLQQKRVLIIDDFLMCPVSREDVSNLVEIIEERSQLGPVIITTQYPASDWHKLLPDPTIADAICDRLIHTSIKFNINGESGSMRKKQA